jgi:hypothetical protein
MTGCPERDIDRHRLHIHTPIHKHPYTNLHVHTQEKGPR